MYDTLTGEFIKGVTHQGYSDDSMWARGQAWAIYGYTVVYRETKDVRYLDFVQKVTDVYLKNLPEDYVPYWDFNDPSIPDAPRDASAACVVASALLELSGYLPAEKALEYKQAAVKMLASLSSDNTSVVKVNLLSCFIPQDTCLPDQRLMHPSFMLIIIIWRHFSV